VLVGTGEIENDEGHVRVLEVAGDETLEAFLSCGVPDLKVEHLAANGNVLADKVDADGGLLLLKYTFLVGLN
jgi:hypothetical protein